MMPAMTKNQFEPVWRSAAFIGALVALLTLGACAPATRQPTQVKIEIQDNVGFTIVEEAGISGEARERYQAAHSLFAQQRFVEGIALLEQLVDAEPELSAPRIDLAIAYHQQGDLESAEQNLRAALEQNPTHPLALNELGIIYRKTGRFDEARSSYEKALEVYPGFHSARRNLAVLCDLYLGDAQCALDNYEAYMETVAEDPDVAIWMADLRNRSGGQE